jgi:branched-chain amino acid transport system permease protein
MMRIIALVGILIVVAVIPGILPPFYVRVLELLFFNAALALAWNIMGGFAGYWSFGHTAFIGIGAFAAAHVIGWTAIPTSPLQMVFGVAIGAIFCAVFAAIIAYPVLRLRGIYFAIVMLGISQVVAEFSNNVSWVQGDVGIFIQGWLPDGVAPEIFYYYVFGCLLLFTAVTSAIIRRSRFGYGLFAIREDEDTAKMLGVPTEQLKALGFVVSAAIVGMLGATYGYSLGYFTTDSVFRVDFSLNMIIYCLIGGIGTIAGPILGTAIFLFLTQVVLGNVFDLHLLVTGLVVIVIVLSMPDGVMGLTGSWLWRLSAGTLQKGAKR